MDVSACHRGRTLRRSGRAARRMHDQRVIAKCGRRKNRLSGSARQHDRAHHDRTGRAGVQTIYYHFLYASRFGRGVSLQMETPGPSYDCAVGMSIPYIDAAATISEDESELTQFLVNRSLSQTQECRIVFQNDIQSRFETWTALCGFSPDAVNTAERSPSCRNRLTRIAQNRANSRFSSPPSPGTLCV